MNPTRAALACALLAIVAGAGCAHSPQGPSLCPTPAVLAEHNVLIVHDNDMGFPYSLERVALKLDGAPVVELDAPQLPGCSRNLELHSAQLAEGAHTLSLHLRFHAPGVIRADKEHNKQDVGMESSYAFSVTPDERVTIRAIAVLRDLPERERVPLLEYMEVHGQLPRSP